MGLTALLGAAALVLMGCTDDNGTGVEDREVPHDAPWGIYSLEVETGDVSLMDADGSNSCSITPSYFPATFLCRSATSSVHSRSVYFIGQWF